MALERCALVKVQAQSDFAKNRTLAEQRRFLPVWDNREDLLQIIRENQVVVVVGETGSGKTTQVGYAKRSRQPALLPGYTHGIHGSCHHPLLCMPELRPLQCASFRGTCKG